MAGRSSLGRILYFSRPAASLDTSAGSEGLTNLIRLSKRRNEFNLVTSILVYDRGWFLHCLEGDRDILSGTLGRITADRRHQDMLIIEWMDTMRREYIMPLRFIQRNADNEHLFQKAAMDEVLKRGRPKPTWASGFLNELQSLEQLKADQVGIEALL